MGLCKGPDHQEEIIKDACEILVFFFSFVDDIKSDWLKIIVQLCLCIILCFLGLCAQYITYTYMAYDV